MARERVLRALAAGLLACALCHTATAANQRYIEDEDRFPGWKGVLPSQLQQQPTVQEPAPETTGYGELGQVRPTWKPYVTSQAIFRHLLTGQASIEQQPVSGCT